MSQIVLDAGVFIASVYPEKLTAQAQKLLRQLQIERTIIHAPILLRYELVAVVRKAAFQQRITPQEATLSLNSLLNYPVVLHFDEALLRDSYALATQFNLPTTYDSQYLALAERLECQCWTADERMFNALANKFPSIQFLGNYSI